MIVLVKLLDPRYKARDFASEETHEKGKKIAKRELAMLREDNLCPLN